MIVLFAQLGEVGNRMGEILVLFLTMSINNQLNYFKFT